MKVRPVIYVGLVLLTIGLLVSGAVQAAQPYAGTTINFILQNVSDAEAVKTLVPQFTKDTGIKVNVLDVAYAHLREKIVLALRSPVSAYDVVDIDSIWSAEIIDGGYITPLTDYMKQFGVSDLQDFPVAVLLGYAYNSDLYALPFWTCNFIFFYRKDLFAQTGMEYPKNIDELKKAGAYFTKSLNPASPIKYGIAQHAARTGLTDEWFGFLKGAGGSMFDGNWRPIFNNEAGQQATQAYVDLQPYCPPGVENYEYTEVNTALATGLVAMADQWCLAAPWLENPEKSEAAGKLGYAPMPAGGARWGHHGLGIPKNAKNKEAAYLFINWITSKELEVNYAKAGGNPIRISAWMNPELQRLFPWYQILPAASEKGSFPPRLPEYAEVEDIISVEIAEAYAGRTSVKDALNRAAMAAYDVMKKAGYF